MSVGIFDVVYSSIDPINTPCLSPPSCLSTGWQQWLEGRQQITKNQKVENIKTKMGIKGDLLDQTGQ
jgi:hypothetical protein